MKVKIPVTTIEIEGGAPLGGEVRISGNKNSVLPMIAAALLTEDEMHLDNVPDILDVRNMLEIASELGADTGFSDGRIAIRARNVKSSLIPDKLCSKLRTSILFAGPLLARCGSAKFANPGGDAIGRRRLDAHFYGLKCLGAKFANNERYHALRSTGLKGRELFFDEASVTATEHIMMAAALARGRTIIRNAASEPHVRELGEMLVQMGAEIAGLGTNTLVIDGVEKLNGTNWKVRGDHVEAGSFLALAAATGAELTIRGTSPGNYWMTRRVFEKFNVKMKLNPDNIFVPGGQRLRIRPDYNAAVPVISDGPWPQYPTDMMSCSIVMATQAKGAVLFFEKMFEARMFFVDRLIAMGANALVCDPHRVLVTGPTPLRGTEMSSPDIRAGMALVIAALCAKGTSTIKRADIIERGYENLTQKISSIGGRIRPRQ